MPADELDSLAHLFIEGVLIAQQQGILVVDADQRQDAGVAVAHGEGAKGQDEERGVRVEGSSEERDGLNVAVELGEGTGGGRRVIFEHEEVVVDERKLQPDKVLRVKDERHTGALPVAPQAERAENVDLEQAAKGAEAHVEEGNQRGDLVHQPALALLLIALPLARQPKEEGKGAQVDRESKGGLRPQDHPRQGGR